MSKGRAFLVVGHKNIHFKRGFDGFDRLMNSSDSVCRISASGETLKDAFRLRRVFISTLNCQRPITAPPYTSPADCGPQKRTSG
jgi:hypothetical protein